MTDNKIKGNLIELKVIESFISLGYTVSIPYGDSSRYDLVVDIDGRLFKVQVKFPKIEDGAICIRGFSANSRGRKRYLSSEVDFLATYYNGNCYLVRVVGDTSKSTKLRLLSAKNSQKENINFANDFLLKNVIAGLTQLAE